jgi:hypothetical protein
MAIKRNILPVWLLPVKLNSTYRYPADEITLDKMMSEVREER